MEKNANNKSGYRHGSRKWSRALACTAVLFTSAWTMAPMPILAEQTVQTEGFVVNASALKVRADFAGFESEDDYPASVTVQLLKNGEAYGSAQVLSAQNNWTADLSEDDASAADAAYNESEDEEEASGTFALKDADSDTYSVVVTSSLGDCYVSYSDEDDETVIHIAQKDTTQKNEPSVLIVASQKDSDDALTGAVFGYYELDDDGKETLVYTAATNKSGNAAFPASGDFLGDKIYEIREILAPEGGELSDSVWTVTYADGTVNVDETTGQTGSENIFVNVLTPAETTGSDAENDESTYDAADAGESVYTEKDKDAEEAKEDTADAMEDKADDASADEEESAGTYVAEPVDDVLKNVAAYTNIDGNVPSSGQFSYVVTDNATKDIVATGTNTTNGQISFTPIPVDEAGDYEYTVSQVPGNNSDIEYSSQTYTLTSNVQDVDGKLTADTSLPEGMNQLTFDNSNINLKVDGTIDQDKGTVEVTFTGEVTLLDESGNKVDLSADMFNFQSSFKVSGGTDTQKTTNDANGSIDFGSYTFPAPSADSDKEYQNFTMTFSQLEGNTSLLQEKLGTTDIIYNYKENSSDRSADRTVKVRVSRSSDGTVSWNLVEEDSDELSWTNKEGKEDTSNSGSGSDNNNSGSNTNNGGTSGDTDKDSDPNVFTGTAEKVAVGITCNVTLDNKNPTDGQFKFKLTKKDEASKYYEATNVGQAVTFEDINFTSEGTYAYTLKQTDMSDTKIDYDTQIYDVKVVVEKNSSGNLVATVTYSLDGNAIDLVPVFANTTNANASSSSPSNSTTPSSSSNGASTSAQTNYTVWIVVAVVAIAAVVVLFIYSRKDKNKDKAEK